MSLLLADEFFFIALDDRTGRPRLSPGVFGLGLAGALLGELILDGRLAVEGDRLRVVDQRPPADALAHTTLDQLLAEPADHPARTWLGFFARTARDQVATRLRRGGHIRIETTRKLLRRGVVYPPTNVNTAYLPTARLASTLSRGSRLSWPDAALCGLVAATGLDGHLLFTRDSTARDHLRRVIEQLTPSLHGLVWHLHAAVGDAVLTGRA